jgi:hypothetical protein
MSAVPTTKEAQSAVQVSARQLRVDPFSVDHLESQGRCEVCGARARNLTVEHLGWVHVDTKSINCDETG